jgi:D-alanyl-lipoteichoic acid acyltransferase DltB (MBOAT superfamily)
MTGLLVILTWAFWLIGRGIGKAIERERERQASLLTTLSVIVGIGALFYFKYLDFFIGSFVTAANLAGMHLSWTALHLVVPVGLSFFTFKLMSYTLDIYHGKISHESNVLNFANFIAFFPTILSGPIDRPKPFLKQLTQSRLFNADNLKLGFRRVLWGMFMKMCIADRLDLYISAVWNNYEHHSASSILFASLLYPFQMYADFSGYSEMAIGVSLMLGFKVAENFKRPFFTINIAQYWSRWHMSLTSWLTDYVFMPLNIKLRGWGTNGTITAIMLNMTFIGMWHGADWTFFLFGIYHGLWYIPLMANGQFFKKTKIKVNNLGWPTAPFVLKMVGNYLVVTFGLMLFHSNNISEFWDVLCRIPQAWNGGLFFDMPTLVNAAICSIALIYVDIQEEWFTQKKLYLPNFAERWRWELTVAVEIVAILLFGIFDSNQFIYFQF